MSQDVLIVDDEADIGRLISETLDDEGYQTRSALDGASAIEAIQARCPNLVLLDIWLGDSRFDGIKVLEILKKNHPHLPVLMMSGHGTIETAVQAIKKGAYDFIEKPFKADRLLLAVQRALEAATLRRENSELKARTLEINEYLGVSPFAIQFRQLLERVASTNSRILISGNPGTGKEVVARLLHQTSRRKNGSFVVLNCATLEPDRFERVLFGTEDHEGQKTGLFEQAHLGTLLFDEVTDMPLETQGKILHSLQEQTFTRIGGKRKVEVDVRVIASTSRDLKKALEEKTFREDLYYRLNVVPIKIPPLKERREDIPVLVNHLIGYVCAVNGLSLKTFSEEALIALQSYEWPGNIRQLKNVIEWVLIMASENDSDIIEKNLLPGEIYGEILPVIQSDQNLNVMSLTLREARENFEKSYLQAQVERFGGNVSRTADFIKMERAALHRKLRDLQIKRTSRP